MQRTVGAGAGSGSGRGRGSRWAHASPSGAAQRTALRQAGPDRAVRSGSAPAGGRGLALAAALLAGLVAGGPALAGTKRIHENVGFELFESPQANPIVLSPDGNRLFVADTVANSVEVFDTVLRLPVATIPVGFDPVSLELLHDGR